jgi:RNA polymerase sigma factor (sigma-70 family)
MAKPVLRELVLRQLDRTLNAAASADSELLERFNRHHDETAFAALVQRHGPMVLGICRRMLDSHTAEDAFQATFLVLVRKAPALRQPELLASWLYCVASRVARKARGREARWQTRDRQVPDVPAETVDDSVWCDLRAVIDEEVSQLPEKYRAPVVLCYLEGKAYGEAARSLGCPAGTVSGRLARARVLLLHRLARRGLTVSGTALTLLLTEQKTPAAVPPLLARAAVACASSAADATVPSSVVILSEGVLKTMFVNRLKAILVAVFIVGLLSSGVGWIAAPNVTGQPAAAADVSPGEKKLLPESIWTDLADGDTGRVTRAIVALTAAGSTDACVYLAERLQPVKVDEARVQQIIADLDSPAFGKRQQAAAELEYLGKFVKPQLDKALTRGPSAELRKRIEQLLNKLPHDEKKQPAKPMGFGGASVSSMNGQVTITGQVNKLIVNGTEVDLTPKAAAVGPSPLWIRAVRAVAVLEQMGTPEAKHLLEKVAQGEAEALPTKEAKAALERLTAKR